MSRWYFVGAVIGFAVTYAAAAGMRYAGASEGTITVILLTVLLFLAAVLAAVVAHTAPQDTR